MEQKYSRESDVKRGVKGFFAKLFLHYFRQWDLNTVNRIDAFAANSWYIANRIQKVYRREATVIYPPVNIQDFAIYYEKEDFYLTASRFVPYKKVDLIVEAFTAMPDKKLVVIGSGPDANKIRAKAGENIQMIGFQSFEVLKYYMQRAKAFVFAADEDFGKCKGLKRLFLPQTKILVLFRWKLKPAVPQLSPTERVEHWKQ